MRLVVFLMTGLYLARAFGLDSESQEWINVLQKDTQGTEFMSYLGQEEMLANLMEHEDTNNPISGSTSAKALVDKASQSQSGKTVNQFLEQVNASNSNSTFGNANAKIDAEELNGEGIGAMLKKSFLGGPKIAISRNEPLILHAEKIQNAINSDQVQLQIPIDVYTYDEYSCQESIHKFNETVKERLVLDFEEPLSYTQDISLYASVHNEFSVVVTADLVTGAITSVGNGENRLYPSSNVTNPLGKVPEGAIIELKRSKPYAFWNGLTESIEVSLGTEPSQKNGFQYAFGLSQHNCNNKNKGLCNQYRGMQHHWQATIWTPPKVISEYWLCPEKLKLLVGKGICKPISSKCVGMPESRVFGIGDSQISVQRDCWEKEITYQCVLGGQFHEGCDKYKIQGCEQIESVCKQFEKDVCILYEQHYRCPQVNHSSSIDLNLDLNEISKDGQPLAFEENSDFGEALGALGLAASFAKEQVTQDGEKGYFFNGNAEDCEVLPKQCCAQEGVFKKVFGCSENEEALVTKVQQGLCNRIGDTKKGVFHQKKRHFCCFNSKLARVVQAGAREQLGIGFGTPEAPNCRALSVEEIARIDWSRVDFSEIAQDFTNKVQKTKLSDSSILNLANNARNNVKVSETALSSDINHKIEVLSQESSKPKNNFYTDQLLGEQDD